MTIVSFTVRQRKRIVVVGLVVIMLVSIAYAIDFLSGGRYWVPSIWPPL